MADAPALLKYVKQRIAQTAWFLTEGFTNQQIYRQYLPQVKNPIYPCQTLSYETDKRETFADVDTVHLFVSVHSKEFDFVERVSKLISETMHTHTYSDDSLIIYKCIDVGIPTVPSFNKDLNVWESVVEFECLIG